MKGKSNFIVFPNGPLYSQRQVFLTTPLHKMQSHLKKCNTTDSLIYAVQWLRESRH